jgi:GTP:adenosylcobinamide-phosphate guanylyltransferase
LDVALELFKQLSVEAILTVTMSLFDNVFEENVGLLPTCGVPLIDQVYTAFDKFDGVVIASNKTVCPLQKDVDVVFIVTAKSEPAFTSISIEFEVAVEGEIQFALEVSTT